MKNVLIVNDICYKVLKNMLNMSEKIFSVLRWGGFCVVVGDLCMWWLFFEVVMLW